MRDFYRRYLMLLGGGALVTHLSLAGSAKANPQPEVIVNTLSAETQEAAPQPHASLDEKQTTPSSPLLMGSVSSPEVNTVNPLVQTPSAQASPEAPQPTSPEVSEEALPLEPSAQAPPSEEGSMASETSQLSEEAPLDSSPDSSPGEMEQTVPLDEGPDETMPETSPEETLPEETSPEQPSPESVTFEQVPDYLRAIPNPLEIQTQPEEVEIIGTQPLSLETAVDVAYRNNQDLQVALLTVQRSRDALREARAALFPTVDLQGTLQSGNTANVGDLITGSDNVQTFANGGVQVNYDLGLSGRRGAQIRAAEEQLHSDELNVEVTREQLRLDVTTDYYALQEAVEQIRINQTFLDEAERNLRDASLREEVGVGTRFDVLRAEVQVANARQAVTDAISQKQIAQRQLASRLNIPPSIDLSTTPVEIAGSWPLSLEESIVQAYQNRAELEQLLAQRTISEQQRQVALSAVRPDVGLFANYNLQQFLSGTATGLDDGFSVGAQLQWRIFDGGAAVAGADQQERNIEIAEEQFSQTRNQIRFQVEQSYFNLQSNQENIDTAKLAVEQAREALDLANLRFNAGVGTQLDVLSATRDLADAEGNLVTAILNYNRALASMERAVSNLSQPDTGTNG
jgi:outer membrane protein TolC